MKKIFNIQINQDILKIIALLTMTLDHIAYILHTPFETVFRLMGRLSFPLFVFLIVFNLSQKNLFKKYISRLFGFALISTLSLIYFKSKAGEIIPLNILWTLLLGVVTIYTIKTVNNLSNKFLRYLTLAYVLLFAIVLSFIVDYEVFGLLYMLSMYGWFNKKHFIYGISAIIFSFLINIHISLTASVISAIITSALLLPISQSAKAKRFLRPWWLFYAYYPLHLVVIYIIALY